MAKKKKVGLNNLALLASVATVLGMSSMVYFKMTRVGDNVLAATTSSSSNCISKCDRLRKKTDMQAYNMCVSNGESRLTDNGDALYIFFRTQVLGRHDASVKLTKSQEAEVQKRMRLYKEDLYKNGGTSEDIKKHCASLHKAKDYKETCKSWCMDQRIPKPTPMNVDDIPSNKPPITPTAVPTAFWSPPSTPTPTAFRTPQNSDIEEKKNKPEKSSVITRQINYARDTLNRILAR